MQEDLDKWKIFFCDERVVSEDSKDSTYGTVKRGLLTKNKLTEHQFIKIKQGLKGENWKNIKTCFNFLLNSF